MRPMLGDAALKVTRALPNGAANVTSGFLPLGNSANGDFLANGELLIELPAQVTGVLGDATTIICDVLTSDSADGSNPVTVAKAVLTQTGAGGAGAAAVSARFRPTSDTKSYIGVKATKSATGDASGTNMTVSLRF